MKILFVCKYNRFRSRVAEAYFKKVNKNKKIIAKSAGIIRGIYPLNFKQVEAAKEFGITINGKPESLSVELLKKVDLIIIVANDVPKEIFRVGGKYLQNIKVWNIPDVKTGKNLEENIKIIRIIINKVDALIKEMEKAK